MKYKLIDVGRGKFCGEIEAQTGQPEHVEAAILKVIREKKILRSNGVEIYFEQDEQGIITSGEFVVGGFRTVGKFERITA